jgi:hypothetical protein
MPRNSLRGGEVKAKIQRYERNMNIKENRRKRREEDEKLKGKARTFLENRKGEEFSLSLILEGIRVNLQARKKERVIIISDMQGRLRQMLRELEKEELIEIIERDSEEYYKYKE